MFSLGIRLSLAPRAIIVSPQIPQRLSRALGVSSEGQICERGLLGIY